MPPRLTSVDLSAGPIAAGLRRLTPLLLAGVVAVGLSACGRRGQPEPPPDPAATQKPAAGSPSSSRGAVTTRGSASSAPTTLTTRPQALTENSPDDETDEEDPNAAVSPQPTPAPIGRRRARSYQVPKEPFILDPLL
jgi:hypothetical protein